MNSIFSKLGLSDGRAANRRGQAVLVHLQSQQRANGTEPSRHQGRPGATADLPHDRGHPRLVQRLFFSSWWCGHGVRAGLLLLALMVMVTAP